MIDEHDTVRCFIAVELPEEVKQALAKIQQQLQARVGRALGPTAAQAVRWVAPQGIHLTLKFLGNTPAEKLPPIEAALDRALSNLRAFTIKVEGHGMFPNQSRPRVIWVGITGQIDDLAELQRLVEAAIVSVGFPSEQRAFSPHLTLARVREELQAAERRMLGSTVADASFDYHLSVPVCEVSLMRSELRRGGAQYSRIAAVALKN